MAVNPLAQIKHLGGFAWVSVIAMVVSQVCFILAVQSGNTAEIFFLMSLAPLMAAVLARPILGERLGVMGIVAIAIALGPFSQTGMCGVIRFSLTSQPRNFPVP